MISKDWLKCIFRRICMDAIIQKFLDDKKENFFNVNHLINSLKSDELWQDYRESLINDLQQKYTLIIE